MAGMQGDRKGSHYVWERSRRKVHLTGFRVLSAMVVFLLTRC